MQKIVIERPYQFIPPHRGNWWPTFAQKFRLVDYWLRKSHGVVEYECRDVHYLRESLAAGHGIMLTPNHCRPADPIVMGFPAREANTHVFAMASWHLFHQDRFSAWAIHKVGGFSINREGIDRKSMDTAIEILDTAERPLIVFPEGSRNTESKMGQFKSGLYYLGKKRPDLELVPVYIDNLNRVLPRGEFLPVPLLSCITFGPPIWLEAGEPKHEFLKRAREAVRQLKDI